MLSRHSYAHVCMEIGMSVAAKVGRGLGAAVGWTAATAYKGAVLTFEATGEFGEAAYEGMTESFDAQCERIDAKVEARKAKAAAAKAAALAAREEAPAIAAPVKAKKAVAA